MTPQEAAERAQADYKDMKKIECGSLYLALYESDSEEPSLLLFPLNQHAMGNYPRPSAIRYYFRDGQIKDHGEVPLDRRWRYRRTLVNVDPVNFKALMKLSEGDIRKDFLDRIAGSIDVTTFGRNSGKLTERGCPVGLGLLLGRLQTAIPSFPRYDELWECLWSFSDHAPRYKDRIRTCNLEGIAYVNMHEGRDQQIDLMLKAKQEDLKADIEGDR